MQVVVKALVLLGLAALCACFSPVAAAATSPPGWSTPDFLDGRTGGPLAMNENGTALDVWALNGTEIWGSRQFEGSPWETPVMIANATTSAWSPKVGIDGTGNGLAIWWQNDSTGAKIGASVFSATEGWQAPINFTHPQFLLATCAFSMAADGSAFVAWVETASVVNWNATLFVRRFTSDDGWEPEHMVDSALTAYSANILALDQDDQGNAALAWVRGHAPYSMEGIQVARFARGMGWGSPVNISGNIMGGWGTWLDLSMRQNGEIVVVWASEVHLWSGAHAQQWSARWYEPEAGWGEVQNLSLANAPYCAFVSIGGRGKAVAMWGQTLSTGATMWVSDLTADTGWGIPQRLAASGYSGCSGAIEADLHGNAFATWLSYGGGAPSMLVARFTAGVGWGRNQNAITPPGVGTYGGVIAVTDSGDAILLWSEDGDSVYPTYTARYARDTVPPTIILAAPAAGSTSNATAEVEGVTEPFATVIIGGSHFEAGADGAFGGTIVLQEGTHMVIATAVDSGGNSASAQVEVTLDTTPPTLACTAQVEGSPTREGLVAVRCTINEAATVRNAGSVVHSGPSAGEFTLDWPLQEGPNTLVLTATDGLLNEGRLTLTLTRDSTPPALDLRLPLPGVTRLSDVPVAGTTEPGLTVEVAGAAAIANGDGAFALTLSLEEGPHTLVIEVRDSAGNENHATISIVVDATPPFLTVRSPTPGLWNRSTVEVAGDTERGGQVAVNGLSVSVDEEGAFSMVLTVAEGPITIGVAALDAAGNTVLRIVEIVVDTTPPEIRFATPAEGSVFDGPTTAVVGHAEPGTRVTVNGNLVEVGREGSFTLPWQLAVGVNTLTAVATDAAGNSATATLAVSYSPPSGGVGIVPAGSPGWIVALIAAAVITVAALRIRTRRLVRP